MFWEEFSWCSDYVNLSWTSNFKLSKISQYWLIYFSLGSNPSQSSSSKRNDIVVDELNRRNSVISATCASNSSHVGKADPSTKPSELNAKHSSSEYIPYGKSKNVTASTNESQNVMKGIPTVRGSRYILFRFWLDVFHI